MFERKGNRGDMLNIQKHPTRTCLDVRDKKRGMGCIRHQMKGGDMLNTNTHPIQVCIGVHNKGKGKRMCLR